MFDQLPKKVSEILHVKVHVNLTYGVESESNLYFEIFANSSQTSQRAGNTSGKGSVSATQHLRKRVSLCYPISRCSRRRLANFFVVVAMLVRDAKNQQEIRK